MTRCPYCWVINGADFGSCTQCGAPLPVMSYLVKVEVFKAKLLLMAELHRCKPGSVMLVESVNNIVPRPKP